MTRVKGKPEKTGGKLVVPEYDDVIVYSMGKVASSSISIKISSTFLTASTSKEGF